MVLKDVSRDSCEDFLCAKKFPNFLPNNFVDFLDNSSGISVYSPTRFHLFITSYSSFRAEYRLVRVM
jgi:hypothetical protein